jgi:hypothetical protein
MIETSQTKSGKKRAKDSHNNYYTIAIPKEIGDQFPDGAWFVPELRRESNQIVLRRVL